jgi:phenylpropionate dioxygenase-like ring-hydroxylating dioxygenase large terminal subunit
MTEFIYPELTRHWLAVCPSAKLRARPLARTVLGVPMVFFRGENGQPAALLDRCPHRNAPLSAGWTRSGCVVCPYHGWQFDSTGICRDVPGLYGIAEHKARVTPAFPVVEQDGLVWVYPQAGTPPVFLPRRLAHIQSSGYSHFFGEVILDGALPDVLENFLDGSHTHFVHAGLIRTEGYRKDIIATVRRGADWVEAEYSDEGKQSGVISQLFGAGVDKVFGRFRLPAIAELEYCAGKQVKMLITLLFTPMTETRHHLLAVVVGKAPRMLAWVARPIILVLFWQALQQDRRILELQLVNTQRFGVSQYVYIELDLLAPHIIRLLKHGPLHGEDSHEEQVQMRI